MKKIMLLCSCLLIFGCANLSGYEYNQYRKLEMKGISVDNPQSNWYPPASPLAAGLWGILPGGGDFYLAGGEAGDSGLWLPGFLNLLVWPFSIIWEIPQSVIDANNINKRDLVTYYANGGYQ